MEYVLAERLGGMTVGELRLRMAQDEFVHWKALAELRKEQANRNSRPKRQRR